MCDNVRINILGSVGEIFTEILDQFPISSSFNGIVLSRFVTLDISVWWNVWMRYNSIMTNKTCYLELELHLNYSMSCGFKFSSDS